MGRPERSIDPDCDAVQRFAADLRELRRSAGSPTYRELASRAHYSPSALSQAASGQRLPTLPVLLGFVTACGGDAKAWTRRWHEASTVPAEVARRPSGELPAAPPASPPDASAQVDPPRSRRPRWRPAAAALVAAAVAVAAVILTLSSHSDPPSRAAAGARSAVSSPEAPQVDLPGQPVADGADPKRSGCAPDGVTIGAADLFFPGDRLAGTVQLRYSPSCAAAWVRFVPAPTGRQAGDTVTVETYRPVDGSVLPFTISYGDEAVFGDILLTGNGCVAARASIVTGGQRSPSVSTACRTGPGPSSAP